jgi:hypothetical protein
MKDYCENCKVEIEQVDLGNGSFGCPICKRDDCILTPYICNKCEKGYWELNDNEKEEYNKYGEFTCSECICKEMDEEAKENISNILAKQKQQERGFKIE